MIETIDPLNDLFEQILVSFRPFMSVQRTGQEGKQSDMTQYRRPVTDMFETETEVVATFELPGVEKADIDAQVAENVLTVKVEKSHEEEKEGEYRSPSFGFYKAVQLPKDVEGEKIKATYNNGVLEVKLPKVKAAEKKGKRITVE